MITSTQLTKGAFSLFAGILAYRASQALLDGLYSYIPARSDNQPRVQSSTMNKAINVFSCFVGIAGFAGTIYSADRIWLMCEKLNKILIDNNIGMAP